MGCTSLRFLLGQVRSDRLDLLVGVALRELLHDRRRPLAVTEVLELLDEVRLVLTGDGGNGAAAAAIGAVAVGAGRGVDAAGRAARRQRNGHGSGNQELQPHGHGASSGAVDAGARIIVRRNENGCGASPEPKKTGGARAPVLRSSMPFRQPARLPSLRRNRA